MLTRTIDIPKYIYPEKHKIDPRYTFIANIILSIGGLIDRRSRRNRLFFISLAFQYLLFDEFNSVNVLVIKFKKDMVSFF